MGMGGRSVFRVIRRVGGTWDRGPLGRAGTPITWQSRANRTPSAAGADCFVCVDGTRVPTRSALPRKRHILAASSDETVVSAPAVAAADPPSAAALMAMAERVIASSDPETFWAAWLAFEAETNQQLIAQLDAGIPGAELLAWVREALDPACQRLNDDMGAWHWSGDPDMARRQMDHDVAHRCADVHMFIPDYIEHAQWNGLRALCAPASTSLQTLTLRLKTQFGARTGIRCEQMDTLDFATLELAEAMRTILENCIRNAIAHLAAEAPLVVQIVREANRLLVIDTAAGIAPQALARLRAGERIHNGEPVTDGPRGLGWESIRASCARFGIQWAIDSTVGEGTTVTFTFPPDTFTPALDFSIGSELRYNAADLPALLSSFTNAGKVQAAVQLFDHVDTLHAECCRRMERAQDDAEAWQQIKARLAAELANISAAELALRGGLNAAQRSLAISFRSSYTQPLSHLHTFATAALSPQIAHDHSGRPASRTREIDTAHGYRVTAARDELAWTFLAPLLRAAATQEWDGPTLTLRYAPDAAPTDPGYIHQHIDWMRPDPDPILTAIGHVLGWTITTEPTSTGLVVRIDLGETLV